MCIYTYNACFPGPGRDLESSGCDHAVPGCDRSLRQLGNVYRIPKMNLVWVHVADEVLSTAQGTHSDIAKRAAGSSNAAKKTAIVENLSSPHTSRNRPNDLFPNRHTSK